MRILRWSLVLLCLACFGWLGQSVQAQEVVLTDVPTYYWWRGCSPTAGMMALGYWDAYGYGNLIAGSNNWTTNEAGIKNAIASTGHIVDYALYDGVRDDDEAVYPSPYADMSEVNPTGAHPNDCLADFMGTSRSALGLRYGGTWPAQIFYPDTWFQNVGAGLKNYAASRGHSFDVNHDGWLGWTPSWAAFVGEVQFGRPVVLNVDATAPDGRTGGHSVVAIGYKTVGGINYYGFRSTWECDGNAIRWEPFQGSSIPGDWGIYSMERVRPAGTRDTAWTSSVGYWHDSWNWDGGVPDFDAFAFVPNGSTSIVDRTVYANLVHNVGTIQMDGGTLSIGQVRNPGTIIGYGAISGGVKNFGEIAACLGTLQIIGNGSSMDATLRVVNGSHLELRCDGGFDLYGSNTLVGNGVLELVHGTLRALDGETATLASADPRSVFRISGGRVYADTDSTLELDFTNGSRIEIAGGLIGGGTGQVINRGSLEWSSGSMGQGELSNSSPEFLISGTVRIPRGSSLTNTGTIRQVGDSAAVVLGSDPYDPKPTATLNNLAGAVYEFEGDGGIDAWGNSPYFDSAEVNNAGTFRKSAGTGEARIGDRVSFNNTGVVEVTSGTLRIQGGGLSRDGHYEFANGGRIQVSYSSYWGGLAWEGETSANGDGVLSIGGKVAPGSAAWFDSSRFTNGARLEIGDRLNVHSGATLTLAMTGVAQAQMASGRLHGEGTTVNLGNFAFMGGEIGGDGSGQVINQGNFVWTGGSVVGSGGLTNESDQFTIRGNGGQRIGGYYYSPVAGVLTNVGTIAHEADGVLQLVNGSLLNNLPGALYDFQGDGQITGGSGTINNAGVFRKSAGAGQTTIDSYISFNNTGTVEVDSGTLRFNGTFEQTAGTSRLAGGVLAFGTAQIEGGLLTGAGSVIGNVNNSGGVVSPGASAGMMVINGTYTQGASGSLLIELGGLLDGQFDFFDINGPAYLDGRLEIAFLDGFWPQVGDTFRALEYSSRSGAFADIDVLTCPSYQFDALYGSTGMTLVTTAVPEPATLALLTIGMGILLASRRSMRTAVAGGVPGRARLEPYATRSGSAKHGDRTIPW